MLIEVDHADNNQGAQAIAQRYSVDTGPLAMPEHIKIGGLTWDRHKIESYDQQVGEYDIWMEEQIKQGNISVMEALDDIYNKSINGGIIITTRCVPSPWITHAHIVKRIIEKLAGG